MASAAGYRLAEQQSPAGRNFHVQRAAQGGRPDPLSLPPSRGALMNGADPLRLSHSSRSVPSGALPQSTSFSKRHNGTYWVRRVFLDPYTGPADEYKTALSVLSSIETSWDPNELHQDGFAAAPLASRVLDRLQGLVEQSQQRFFTICLFVLSLSLLGTFLLLLADHEDGFRLQSSAWQFGVTFICYLASRSIHRNEWPRFVMLAFISGSFVLPLLVSENLERDDSTLAMLSHLLFPMMFAYWCIDLKFFFLLLAAQGVLILPLFGLSHAVFVVRALLYLAVLAVLAPFGAMNRSDLLDFMGRTYQKAEQAKSEFLMMLSQCIRNPMDAIIATANLLTESNLTSEQQQYSRIILNASESMKALIGNVMDLGKLEVDMMQMDVATFNVPETVGRVCDIYYLQACLRGIELVYEVDRNCSMDVLGDENRIKQILLSYIANAIKSTPRGYVYIRAVAVSRAMPMHIRFEVRDTGKGIDSDESPEALYDHIMQLTADDGEIGISSGLGLAISRALAHKMKGKVGAESKRDVGSTFWFRAPFRTPHPNGNGDANGSAPGSSSALGVGTVQRSNSSSSSSASFGGSSLSPPVRSNSGAPVPHSGSREGLVIAHTNDQLRDLLRERVVDCVNTVLCTATYAHLRYYGEHFASMMSLVLLDESVVGPEHLPFYVAQCRSTKRRLMYMASPQTLVLVKELLDTNSSMACAVSKPVNIIALQDMLCNIDAWFSAPSPVPDAVADAASDAVALRPSEVTVGVPLPPASSNPSQPHAAPWLGSAGVGAMVESSENVVVDSRQWQPAVIPQSDSPAQVPVQNLSGNSSPPSWHSTDRHAGASGAEQVAPSAATVKTEKPVQEFSPHLEWPIAPGSGSDGVLRLAAPRDSPEMESSLSLSSTEELMRPGLRAGAPAPSPAGSASLRAPQPIHPPSATAAAVRTLSVDYALSAPVALAPATSEPHRLAMSARKHPNAVPGLRTAADDKRTPPPQTSPFQPYHVPGLYVTRPTASKKVPERSFPALPAQLRGLAPPTQQPAADAIAGTDPHTSDVQRLQTRSPTIDRDISAEAEGPFLSSSSSNQLIPSLSSHPLFDTGVESQQSASASNNPEQLLVLTSSPVSPLEDGVDISDDVSTNSHGENMQRPQSAAPRPVVTPAFDPSKLEIVRAACADDPILAASMRPSPRVPSLHSINQHRIQQHVQSQRAPNSPSPALPTNLSRATRHARSVSRSRQESALESKGSLASAYAKARSRSPTLNKSTHDNQLLGMPLDISFTHTHTASPVQNAPHRLQRDDSPSASRRSQKEVSVVVSQVPDDDGYAADETSLSRQDRITSFVTGVTEDTLGEAERADAEAEEDANANANVDNADDLTEVHAHELAAAELEAAAPESNCLSVLVVADDAFNHVVLSSIIGTFGHRCVNAASGKQAVQLFTSSLAALCDPESGALPLDLILMGCFSPHQDGCEAAAEIREIEQQLVRGHEDVSGGTPVSTQRLGDTYATESAISKYARQRGGKLPAPHCIPIIALTASVTQQDIQRCMSCGMNGFIPMPVRPELFQSQFDRLTSHCLVRRSVLREMAQHQPTAFFPLANRSSDQHVPQQEDAKMSTSAERFVGHFKEGGRPQALRPPRAPSGSRVYLSLPTSTPHSPARSDAPSYATIDHAPASSPSSISRVRASTPPVINPTASRGLPPLPKRATQPAARLDALDVSLSEDSLSDSKSSYT